MQLQQPAARACTCTALHPHAPTARWPHAKHRVQRSACRPAHEAVVWHGMTCCLGGRTWPAWVAGHPSAGEACAGVHSLTLYLIVPIWRGPTCRYQGHVGAALVLGGFDINGPHLFTVSPPVHTHHARLHRSRQASFTRAGYFRHCTALAIMACVCRPAS